MLKEVFINYLNDLASNPDPAITADGEPRDLRWLLVQLSECSDELPPECCERLTIPTGSTYRAAARKLAGRPVEYFVTRALWCERCRGRGYHVNSRWLTIQQYLKDGRDIDYIRTRTGIYAPDQRAVIKCDVCAGLGYVDWQPLTLIEALIALGVIGDD
ncbi:MAG: hypothetical protein KDI79_15320 [Anaerolineae bacterium]|nr:hypothetical protein [Anaerolineae bacterium]